MKTVCDNELYENVALVTDDTMADKLLTGHLNKIIETAVRAGMPMEKAIYCATWTPSRRMHLDDRGMIAPGKIRRLHAAGQSGRDRSGFGFIRRASACTARTRRAVRWQLRRAVSGFFLPHDQLPSGGDLRLCFESGRSGREMGGSQCHEDRYLRNGDHAGEAQSRGEGWCA